MATTTSGSNCDLLTKDKNIKAWEKMKYPPYGYTLSPWVKVKFLSGDSTITVGNQSSPQSSPQNSHHACIKDFEMGHAPGLECRITIHDEEGGSFVKFMETLLKDAKCGNSNGPHMAEVQFGWIATDCPDDGIPFQHSVVYQIWCREITCNFSGGKFMFEVTGTDVMDVMFEMRMDKIFGGDGSQNLISLTDAITKLLTDPQYPPTVSSVKFLKQNPNADPTPVKFKNHGGDPEKGPLGKWSCNTLDKVNCAMAWLKDWVTVDGKTLLPYYNSEVVGGEIIFWEDFAPGCGESLAWDEFLVGTYIVNGGANSPVIEFNPKIAWQFESLSVGGGMGEQTTMMNTDGGKIKGPDDCKTLAKDVQTTAGSKMSTAAPENVVDSQGANANQTSAQAQQQQLKGLRGFKLGHQPITADLVVIGDPSLPKPSLAITRPVKIIFINPYYVFGGSTTGRTVECGDWISGPLCNEVLSSKGWLVNSINHRISDGKYTTTLAVSLAGPGLDIDVGEPVGGQGSNGWQPPKQC